MEFIKSFIAGAIELGMFLTFGLPVIILAIAVFLFGFQEGNIFSFSGRASRKSFIIKTLLLMFGGTILLCLLIFLAVKFRTWIFTISAIALFLGMFLAYYANIARRLHDLDHSAWWALLFLFLSMTLSHDKSPLTFVPLVLIILLAAIPGTKGPNKYGPDPLDRSRQE
ncbi:MAG: DUF805 domain-containing protein [Acidaminococcaceae bacterium]|nr:DUF805 domain-containing protein [Acidaminococcaceae bacterium]